jgi:RNA polymerase sigma-70 factor, ECF subfamily
VRAQEHEVTRLLRQVSQGDPQATGELFQLLYDDLRRTAAAYFVHQPSEHTLQPTALVHEVYARLIQQTHLEARDRKHFFTLAARVMRQILIDHARGKDREKRGCDWKRIEPQEHQLVERAHPEVDMLALDEALNRLAKASERKSRLIELRFFAGLTLEEAAEVLGISRATASEDWRFARAWLMRELTIEMVQ